MPPKHAVAFRAVSTTVGRFELPVTSCNKAAQQSLLFIEFDWNTDYAMGAFESSVDTRENRIIRLLHVETNYRTREASSLQVPTEKCRVSGVLCHCIQNIVSLISRNCNLFFDKGQKLSFKIIEKL